uniref:Type I restriction enzyme M protein n=1 Tax=Candidatus Kentrum sp. TC TaxID=2126339 RepID=A0A450YB70_9GAMM|nr:MAG: type I restriction enzyme M protein [Candidatus Kentron sp. TC]
MFSELPGDLRLDSEYYRPEYLHQERAIERILHERLDALGDVSDGNHISIAEQFSETGIRYLRGKDLSDFFVSDSDPIFIPKNTYKSLRRSHMMPGDVLLGIVATIGTVSLVTDRFGELTGNCKIAIVRPKRVESEFLAAYFASLIGQREIHRYARGTVQTGIILPDLKSLPIPLLQDQLRVRIVEKVKDAKKTLERSKNAYGEAQSLLESALGLDKLDLAPRLFYERPYADVETAGRCDAEYFQPAHEAVIECCKQYKHGWISLDDLMASITNGVECREFVEDGVPYLRVGDIDGLLLKPSEAKQIARADADTLRPKIALEPGDIVMVRSASIGQTAVISDNTRDSILSSHLIRLRQTKPMRVRPLCLALMLSSLIGVEQTKKHNNGAIVPEVSQSAVRQFIVPLLHNGLQNDIKKHIQASHDAAKEAQRLLDEAKRKVEEAILGYAEYPRKASTLE